jgi:four helix bundle protein
MNPTTNRVPNLQWDVFDATLELIRSLRPPLTQLATKDAALVTQIRRAASSIGLNLAEGKRRMSRDRLHSWRIAAGSAKEVRGSLLIARGLGPHRREDCRALPRAPRPHLRDAAPHDARACSISTFSHDPHQRSTTSWRFMRQLHDRRQCPCRLK